MERKLGSVQRISEIKEHSNADSLEIAKVLGWTVIVKKGEFKPGDLCVYCEVDSIMPERDEFEFLRNKHFRIKTMRLRGVISQGICFPMPILYGSEVPNKEVEFEPVWHEGDDVTDTLGIIKYDPPVPACLSGQVKGMRPSFVPKTDETRIQVVPGVLKRCNGKKLYITEKLDGSSGSYYWKDGDSGVCSRKLDIKEDDNNSFWKVAHKYDMISKMGGYNRNIAIQGELLGPGVQGNKYKLSDHDLFVFNVYDIDKSEYVNLDEMIKVVGLLGMKMVPMVGEITLDNTTVEQMVEMAAGKSALCETKREGIVLRPFEEERDDELGRLSIKVINPGFLLKHDD